ncbi:hypothetical protein [Mycolicibacterium llatzerense]|uniref:hypothetical protein n=1 Tax=Mycolicibacterium llatzerense TaxID=280871 RepID=UPI0021B53A79|nr:hypothetical protein [Mycolicibacterium llatzerense]MCT7371895.1 hypothetical protein [Mycolicibacterium llatzerense]
MTTTREPDDQFDNVVVFPRRGGTTPVEQFDIARGAKATNILAAIVHKYGNLSITVDDIENARADRPYIAYEAMTNSWSVITRPDEDGDDHARTGERR